MSDTHTAANAAPSEAKPSPDASGEQAKDLKGLIAEFDQANPSTEPPQTGVPAATPSAAVPEPVPIDADVLDYVRDQKAKTQKETTDRALTEAYSAMRGMDESLDGQPDKVLMGLIFAELNNNPDFARAASIRGQSPQVWDAALKNLVSDFSADINAQPDIILTANREAARASTRGIPTTTPTPKDRNAENKRITEMTPAEFDKLQKQGRGFLSEVH